MFFKNKIIFMSILFVGCQDLPSQKKIERNNVNKSLTNFNTTSKKNEFGLKDTTGFLLNCQSWNSGTSMGYLQGVEANKDSLGPFCFYECYDCDKTFEIIFIHKGKKGPDFGNLVWNEFENSCNNNYINFNCFAFVYSMRNPDKQRNVHAMNIDFPVNVVAYQRVTGDNWRFVKKGIFKSFKEFSSFQFKTIYQFK